MRVYDPNANQWTTPDAYAGDVHDPMSQKPYMWNNNNGMAYSDPSGYDSVLFRDSTDEGNEAENPAAVHDEDRGVAVAPHAGQIDPGVLRAIAGNAVDLALDKAKGALTDDTLKEVLSNMQTQMNKSGMSMSRTLNGDTIEGHNKLGNSINVTMSASGFSITPSTLASLD